MILYLLFPVLILVNLCVMESPTANVTEEELSKVEGNQTFSTMKPGNVTSSLFKDENEMMISQIKEELQSNETSAVITEDDENFQDQDIEFPGRHCHQDILEKFSHSMCGAVFHTEMLSISRDKWCVLENIIRPYNNMTICLEKLSNFVDCYYPNPNIQDFFLYIHSLYFQNCSDEELLLVDAPQGLVIVLTLIPVSIIPVLVYLVVWKSKSKNELC